MSELASAETFLRRRFPRGGRMLCAVSGGLDSMCLLEFVGALPEFSVAAAHFHHQLRGAAADRDAEFVADWCRRQHIPLFTGTGDTRALAAAEGRSLEEAARRLRYAFLESTAAEQGFDAVLTAHHADDNAETMLLNLLRGTGTAGLAGIPPARGIVCRPFLQLSRQTLAEYARARAIPHVEDETNDMDDAARNVLRHQVLPVLRKLNPQAVEHMSAAAAVVRRESAVLQAQAQTLADRGELLPNGAAISADALCRAPRPVAERAVLQLLYAVSGFRQNFTAAHVAAVLSLARPGREAAQAALPYGLTAARRGGQITLCRALGLAEAALLPGQPMRWGLHTLTWMDRPAGPGLALRPARDGQADRLTVAPCPAGGRLTLPGSRGSRTVKRLCADRGMTAWERDALPALFVDGRLAAVWRVGVDVEFLPAGTACRWIQITKETEENCNEQ